MPSAKRRSDRSARSLAGAEARAREARERGLREGNAGRPAVGARYIRAGLRQLGWTEEGEQADARQVPEAHHALAARLLLILAGWESKQGRTEYGLRLLDRAESLVAAEDRGVLLVQRGLLSMRRWQAADALRMFGEAIVLLEGNPAETANLAAALLNRSFAHLNVGDVRRARADAISCQRVATKAGHDLIVPKALHNLGYCELLAGDIPAALQLLDRAADAYRLGTPGNLPVLAMDKARVLLAAGLPGDAADELDSAMAAFRRQRLDYDLAEAELARSQAALAAGDPAAARRWAAAAGRRFLRHGNDACACLAELTQVRARSLSPALSPGRRVSLAAEARQLAERLRGRGLPDDADLAELLTVRALIAAGQPDGARRHLDAVRRRSTTRPLAVSLLRRLARAELAERDGRSGAALAEPGRAWRWCRLSAIGSAALTCGPAPPPSVSTSPRPACGWRWSGDPHRWPSPGWSVPGRRRSGPGRCARPPTRRPRPSWPSCARSACCSGRPN